MNQRQMDFIVKTYCSRTCRGAYSTIVFFLAVLTILAAPAFASAADFVGNLKGVTITDQATTNKPPTAVIKFIRSGDSFDFDASGSTDSDGSISEYRWDFGDGTIGTGKIISHLYSANAIFSVKLTTVDNLGGVAISETTISKIFSVAVNFQPLSAPVPEGFIVDGGEVFSVARGYGWSAINDARDRNSDPRQEYDTLILPTPWKIWEYTLPNGVYQVTVCIGDSLYPGGNFSSVQIEGTPVFEYVETTAQTKWFEKTVQVTVTDGRLTLSTSGSSPTAELCWLKIIQ